MARFLIITEPLETLDLKWDTSLALARELYRRGHETWACDTADIRFERRSVYAAAQRITPRGLLKFKTGRLRDFQLPAFDLILVRKEPPFDMNYVYLTYLLELVAGRVPIVNHPRGIRNTSEKLSILKFLDWIPETQVTSSAKQMIRFQKKLNSRLVAKVLDQKGGKGIHLIRKQPSGKKELLSALAETDKVFMMAQKFIECPHGQVDKRILVMDGNFLAAYEKRPKRGDFRANLGLGGRYFATALTKAEQRLIRDLRPYFLKEGLFFVGLDVMKNQLIEINVTCPAGIVEAEELYPALKPVSTWAAALESRLAKP